MNKAIVKHDIALAQNTGTLQGQEFGVAGTGTDEIKRPDTGLGREIYINSLAALQTCTRSLMTSKRKP